jgi:uncharacterized membrane protein YqiK
MIQQATLLVIVAGSVIFVAFLIMLARMWHKATQGQALVRTGFGGTKVSFSGSLVVPVIHRMEVMDITVKTIMISRTGKEGLVCKDNMRADIKVTFFVRVNKSIEDVKKVAESIGCNRASDHPQLELLFDAKFSEALKTVGKHFDFVELYNSRDDFKREILQIIGTDLNGYILDDCAIDYLEQTSIDQLNEQNILDSEGIKKIIELTAKQKMEANLIEREKEKTLKKQDVEAREVVLSLERQLAESEEKQYREIQSIKAKEAAEIEKVRSEERLKAENARIASEEQIQVAEQNKERQILVAQRNKEKTDAIELERVEQARALEANERDRIVSLAQIEKEKALEEERKNIQEVIRERVIVEKGTVEEEERIKDTRAHAEAERNKKVAITNAEREAEEMLVKEIKSAEAARDAAEFRAKQIMIDAEAERNSADMKAEAIKIMAQAEAAKEAALGISEAQVLEAKAAALSKQGEAEASVIEDTADAEAKAIRLKGIAQAEANVKLGEADAAIVRVKAEADESRGQAEARVMEQKFAAEAKGIAEKALAMSKLDGPGKDHEEFKLRLGKDKEVELANIGIQKDIADAQAQVIAEALKAANIDIIGGESMFFNQIVGSIAKGKAVDGMVTKSATLQDVKNTFFNPNGGSDFKTQLKAFVDKFGLNSDDIRNLSISALLVKMINSTTNEATRMSLQNLSSLATSIGVSDKTIDKLEM